MLSEEERETLQPQFRIRLRTWAGSFSSYGACARMAGVDQGQLSKWMALDGAVGSAPNLINLGALASAGLNIHWALTGKGPMVWTEELSEAGALVDENRALRIRIADIARRASVVSAELNALLPSEEPVPQE